jgi:hypothetical protein
MLHSLVTVVLDDADLLEDLNDEDLTMAEGKINHLTDRLTGPTDLLLLALAFPRLSAWSAKSS